MKTNNPKLDVHVVQHTHWDREWYFTSDDSRTMLYYDLKSLIIYLEKNDDKFTYDGQSSIIDDFLMYAPDWKNRLAKVVQQKKLLLGPFYTQSDDLQPYGESIMRNIEIGNKMAADLGHSMQVGYMPDVFGHNNQIPQILQVNGINNFSFYRGLDPVDTENQLYFWYESPDGSRVLGHWQTHYSTSPEAFDYTLAGFEKSIVADYAKPGEYRPSVKSYVRRNLGLPIAIPLGTDQRPFRKEAKLILDQLNQKYPEYNFMPSDYETCLATVLKKVKNQEIKLHTVRNELRQALTGRVHRTATSSRMDIKQLLYKLESFLVDQLEPLSVMCLLNQIDVPWKMIEHVWKELFKSSAHDSYATSNEDHVNLKLKNRLINALRIGEGVNAMLTRLIMQKNRSKENNDFSELVLFNLDVQEYSGFYEITTTFKKGYNSSQISIWDGQEQVKHTILNHNFDGSHESDAATILLWVNKVQPFSTKVLNIKYSEKALPPLTNDLNQLVNGKTKIIIAPDKLTFWVNNQKITNFLYLAMTPCVGDTYDHSPITHHDKKYLLTNFKIISKQPNSITVSTEAKVPSGIAEWKTNNPSIIQEAKLQFTIVKDQIHLQLKVTNNSLNGRMSLLVKSNSTADQWTHDQQFGIYHRKLHNKDQVNWQKADKYGYSWDEYPTNLSPHQHFVTNKAGDFSVFTNGTREHEMLVFNDRNYFAFTLYRAFEAFGKSGFLYRPGRGSGAKCPGPDNQLLGVELTYNFLFVFGKLNYAQQFATANQLKAKNHYLPGAWQLERTILRWDTNLDYFIKNKEAPFKKLTLPDFSKNPNFKLTAFYKDPNNRVIARFLNLGIKEIINPNDFQVSRTLTNFKAEKLEVPRFGLVNVLIPVNDEVF